MVTELTEHIPPGHEIVTDNFLSTLELAQNWLTKPKFWSKLFAKTKTSIRVKFIPAKNREVFSSEFGFTSHCTLSVALSATHGHHR